jgi:alkylation response protein AidB-like acyl-CoA dehydrogenase
MNFEFTDDQQAIKRTARDFLTARYTSEVIRELAASDAGFTADQWASIAELGWPGVAVDEEYGGLGLGAVELIVIQEELGYALAPTPLHSTVTAAMLIQGLGTEQQKQQWLPDLAAGEKRGAVAIWDQGTSWEPNRSEVELSHKSLSAAKIAVPDAEGADVFVVAGADGAHFLVSADAPGIWILSEKPLDPTRKLYEVTFNGTPAETLSGGQPGAIGHAHAFASVALAAENVGIAQRTMEMAVEYAQERKQFDRPIGSFQAVAHRCAQMLLETEGARSLTYGAAWALDHDPSTALSAASMAKAYAGDAGYRVAASALQVHGGLGFTWEHDLHFFLKRAKANAYAYGDSAWHRERVMALAGL